MEDTRKFSKGDLIQDSTTDINICSKFLGGVLWKMFYICKFDGNYSWYPLEMYLDSYELISWKTLLDYSL